MHSPKARRSRTPNLPARTLGRSAILREWDENMQTRALKTRKNYPKHVELTVAPVDANTSIAHMLEMVGERKKVLDVGCATGYFANLLVKRECDVVGVDINP